MAAQYGSWRSSTWDTAMISWTIRSSGSSGGNWTSAEVLETVSLRRRAMEVLRWEGLLPVHGFDTTTKSQSNLLDTQQVLNIRIDQSTGTIDTTGIRSLCGNILPALGWIQRDDDTLRDGFRFPSWNTSDHGIQIKDGTVHSSWLSTSSSSTSDPSYGHAFAGASSSSYTLTTLRRIDSLVGTALRRRPHLNSDNSWSYIQAKLDTDPTATIRWTDPQGRSDRSTGRTFLEGHRPLRGSLILLDIRFSDKTTWQGTAILPR